MFKPLSRYLNFYKNKFNFFFDHNMNVNKMLHLIIPNRGQDINFIKTYFKKRQISIYLENTNNSKNN